MLIKKPTGNGKVEVTFTMPALEHVSKLYLVGDFNDWSIVLNPLTQSADGSWATTLPLDAGRSYQFRYFDNNGHWHNDWKADAYQPNQFGGENSLVQVDEVDEAPKPKKHNAPRRATGIQPRDNAMLKILTNRAIWAWWLGSLAVFSSSAFSQQAQAELLIYCGITMIRPMTEIAQAFEQKEKVKITLAQGGSEDLYQSAKKSGQGDLYLPGEPTYRDKHLAEGLLGEVTNIGYNQMAIMTAKGNPKKIKGDPKDLLREEITVIIGDAASGSVGQETKRILDSLGLYQQIVDKALSLSSDSRSLNSAMKKGEADAVLNWRATGFFPDNAAAVDVIDMDPKVAKPQALLLILLTFSKNQDIARRFMAFAASEEGQAVFRKHGFLDNKTSIQ